MNIENDVNLSTSPDGGAPATSAQVPAETGNPADPDLNADRLRHKCIYRPPESGQGPSAPPAPRRSTPPILPLLGLTDYTTHPHLHTRQT
ncbi:hypothetical protein D0861_05045 [Hortaea werneckii]|uniref:Uncharacterized protein n=1 Tax=Hortaea werneckii TaxID=91943 RepID=A0A3M7FHU7_HORWE|nr:hypothetical protein D0861_05045 [Hortaea werneckii]